MASTDKTDLLKLPQWQDNDKLEMTDLNDAFEKVDTGLTTHKAENAQNDVHDLLSDGKIIEESGINANGEYVRFADGTQICTMNIIYDTTDNSSLTQYALPASFALSYVGVSLFGSNSPGSFSGTLTQVEAISKISGRCSGSSLGLRIAEASTLTNLGIAAALVGRWK